MPSPLSKTVRGLVAFVALLAALAHRAAAHSQMSWPQSTAPMTCRMGGESRSGVSDCPGPCDLRAIRGRYAHHGSASRPAATYRRGGIAHVKYQRNNHGPGGFQRLTLVPVSQMMDKAAHARNAFFYSCWGAKPAVATHAETRADAFGYSITGNDGDEHRHGKAFYQTFVRIPECVPDGDYVLGWVWYGGIGSPVEGNSPTRPKPWGFFADYWSCAFVRVSGGAPVKQKCRVAFDNDMAQFSTHGCMAANDRPGVCVWEPCKRNGSFQKPAPFKGGKQPFVHSWMYGAARPHTQPKQAQRQNSRVSKTARNKCRCVGQGNGCLPWVARLTSGVCRARTARWRQPVACRTDCCKYCRVRDVRGREAVCWARGVREVCGWQW